MPATPVQAKFEPLTADGGVDGWVAIASNAGWLVGAYVWIRDDNTASLKCRIAAKRGSTEIRLRDADQNYGFSHMNAYTAAQNASVAMAAQVVAVRSVFSEVERA